MHISHRGAGPALVLVHGWAMHSGVFEPLLQHLEQHFRCHLVDLPGHGHSPERSGLNLDHDLDRLLTLLPVAPWLGWSLGAIYAIEAALRAPEHVPALISIAGSPCFVRKSDWPHAVEAEVFERFGCDLHTNYSATIGRFLALEVQGDVAARSEIRWLRERLSQRPAPASAALTDGLALLSDTDLRAQLPSLRVPSYWIAGQHDRLVPSTALQQAAESAPNARFLSVRAAGHAPFLVQPEAIAGAVWNWLPAVARVQRPR